MPGTAIARTAGGPPGSAFKPFAGIEREKLVVTGGAGNLLVYGDADGNDTHCATCGSLVYSVIRDSALVHVAMGTLVEAPSIRPSVHIFVGSEGAVVHDHR